MSNFFSGGLRVSPEMARIVARPGFLSVKVADRGFEPCIPMAIESGTAPLLNGTETPFLDGYTTLVVLGSQRIEALEGQRLRHLECLRYLISKGAPVDSEDIVGHTALFHATAFRSPNVELARALIEAGANVNHRNRYGEISLLPACMGKNLDSIELLLEHGADLDIAEADGLTTRSFFVSCGPEVAEVVSKWIRKRAGETALMENKMCRVCGKQDKALNQCSRCKSVRYCSAPCQRQDWSTHKKDCVPFSNETTVTLKPFYLNNASTFPTATLLRNLSGIPAESPTNSAAAAVPKSVGQSSKDLIIKVQVPYNLAAMSAAASSQGDLMVYNKKRDFACSIRRVDAPDAYDRISQAVKTKGVGGAKGYFAAVLESKDKLVVKVSELLAPQPW
ncbi:hypothetical protein HGRIS_007193 [Hohenbuehelia grisea]|uniref:MYND-type domain-containing protein n=1 Tax=Hohenbuehelia grisea TaxID=104357 RepID=A0ABR3JBC0_9AGAR